MSKMQKRVPKSVSVEKAQVGIQFLPLVVCPLPPRAPSLSPGEDWVKTVGKTTVRIVSSSRYGTPYGRDILIVLYLIQEAMKQGGPVIRLESLKHYLDTFRMDGNRQHYKEAMERFKRIFYSSWFWEDKRGKGDIEDSTRTRFHIIDSWNVYFDPDNKGSNPLFDSFIQLSPRFWEIVKEHPVPYNLDAVCHLKDKPAALALYLFLVYRTWTNWKRKRGAEYIPFFGEKGLQAQISSDIAQPVHFREQMKKWIKEIQQVWPDCPVYQERETDPEMMGPNRRKRYKDGLTIHCTKPGQLHVEPHWDKELRLAQEEAKETEQAALVEKLKPTAKQAAVIRRGGTEEQIRLLDAGEMTRAEASEIIGGILAQAKVKRTPF